MNYFHITRANVKAILQPRLKVLLFYAQKKKVSNVLVITLMKTYYVLKFLLSFKVRQVETKG